MNRLYRDDTIVCGVEIFPTISREAAAEQIGILLGVSFEEREVDEFSLFEASIPGFSLQIQINYDWDLADEEKQSIVLLIDRKRDRRTNISHEKSATVFANIPTSLSKNENGEIDISNYIAQYINESLGYKCVV